MKKIAALSIVAAVLAANVAYAEQVQPLTSTAATQGDGLAGLLGTTFGGGTIIAATLVAGIIIVTILGDSGTTSTTVFTGEV
ncbi:hypothetical protein [Roseicyclus mahoneyensis]|uniref:Secreted protein n=1 Tax=Roseicyclus mahoneyensis TaxID=164332 RepID=A0A316GKM3_9RHOB|nr:hypothetical protein [Roseicyclus mahoneyensis]PWK60538.1 hypothetical protein C7455_104175 [Roseicyclus mahoneyensis]